MKTRPTASRPADMRTIQRSVIVVICYLLSSYGIISSMMLIALSGIKSLPEALIGIAILLAWVAHIVMSASWVINRKVEKFLPVWGTTAGALGLTCWPVVFSNEKYQIGQTALQASAMGIAFTLPCFLLAIYLVWFHLKSGPSNAELTT